MVSWARLWRLAVVGVLLGSLALFGVGCSKANKHRADEFVGTWAEPKDASSEVMLDLKGDGLGTSRFAKYPNVETVRWSVVGDSLVLASMDGTQTTDCPYRLDTPTKMTLKVEGKEHTLLKEK